MRSSLYFLKVCSSEEWRELEGFPAQWGVPQHPERAGEFYAFSQKNEMLVAGHLSS